VDVGRGRMAARAAAAGLCTASVAWGCRAAAPPLRAEAGGGLSRVERARHATRCPTTGAAVKTLANLSSWP
jgi:hypothetical protein